MLRAAIVFFVLALVSIIFGANGLAGLNLDLGKGLLFIFLILSLISFVAGMMTREAE